MGPTEGHSNDRGIELVRDLLKGTMVRNKHGVGELSPEMWLL